MLQHLLFSTLTFFNEILSQLREEARAAVSKTDRTPCKW